MSYEEMVSEIEVPTTFPQHYHFVEKLADVLATPVHVFFGRKYYLNQLPNGQFLLKSPETFTNLKSVFIKIAVLIFWPISLEFAVAGLILKALIHIRYPKLREKYSFPKLINARLKENFLGKLPQNPWTPNCVNSQQKSSWGELYQVEPIAVPDHIKDPISLIQSAIDEGFDKSEFSLVEEIGNYLHYIFYVKIPRGPLKGIYIDDVDLYYNVEKKIIDIRSASRVGFRDAGNLNFKKSGANKKRVEQIRTHFEKLARV